MNRIDSVYARGSPAVIMIQENLGQSVQNDVITLLRKMTPSGIWEHDYQDNNGEEHLKPGMPGDSQTIPIIDYNPGLSTWKIIFFYEDDGLSEKRDVKVTIIADI